MTSPVPPRPVLWTQHPYVLTELIHPVHVMYEGKAMRNCLNVLAPSGAPLMEFATEETADQLRYWKDIQRGRLRMFSFGTMRKPLVTLAFRILPRFAHLADMQSHRNHSINGTEPWIDTFLQAIQCLPGVFATKHQRTSPPELITGLPIPYQSPVPADPLLVLASYVDELGKILTRLHLHDDN